MKNFEKILRIFVFCTTAHLAFFKTVNNHWRPGLGCALGNSTQRGSCAPAHFSIIASYEVSNIESIYNFD